MNKTTKAALLMMGALAAGAGIYAVSQKKQNQVKDQENQDLKKKLEEATSLREIIKEKDEQNRRLASSIGFDRAKNYYTAKKETTTPVTK